MAQMRCAAAFYRTSSFRSRLNTSKSQREFRFLAPRYWPVWLGLGLLRLLATLPYRWQVRFGRRVGRTAYALMPRRRTIAETNLRLCFPEWDAAQREKVLRHHFEAVGIAFFETAMCWWWSDERLRSLMRIDGLEHLQDGLTRGKGVILLGAHFTSLEIGLRLLAVQIEPRIHPVYQIHSNPLLERIITGNRERHSGKSIPHNNIREMLRTLKQNKVVWYAPDQGYSGKHSAMVPFFGIPAATHTATSRLARASGAAVVPICVRRLPGNDGYRVILHAPFENFPSDDVVADTLRYHQFIEEQTRIAPEQYLWIHRRFKGRPAEYPDVYARPRT